MADVNPVLVVHPRLAGHGPTLFAGLSKHLDLKLVERLEFWFGSSGAAVRAEKVISNATQPASERAVAASLAFTR